MLLIIILIFAFTAYATSATLGSPGAVFDLLVQAAAEHPVDGNAGGSYLTMRSQQGGKSLGIPRNTAFFNISAFLQELSSTLFK